MAGSTVNHTCVKNSVAPLHTAAEYGFSGVVRILKKHGAEVNARTSNDHETPLHYAAITGQTDTVVTLLELGADKEATDIHGMTPLNWALANKHDETAKVLQKADTDSRREELKRMLDLLGEFCGGPSGAYLDFCD